MSVESLPGGVLVAFGASAQLRRCVVKDCLGSAPLKGGGGAIEPGPQGHLTVGNSILRGNLGGTGNMGASPEDEIEPPMGALFATASVSHSDIEDALDGAPYFPVAQFYLPSMPPVPVLPALYLDMTGAAIVDGPANLPPGGVTLTFDVPPGSFVPVISRVQLLVITPQSQAPFGVATSDAQDLMLL